MAVITLNWKSHPSRGVNLGERSKDICKHPDLVDFQWEDEGSGSQWSIVQFNHFLQEPDTTEKQKLKQQILSYNHDDAIAIRRLEEWLRNFPN